MMKGFEMSSAENSNMANMVGPQDVFKALLDEYNRRTSHIQQLLMQSEKFSSTWLAIVALAFSVGLNQKTYEVFLFIPIGLLALAYWCLATFEFVSITAGYAAHLEDRINSMIRCARVLNYERLISPRLGHVRASVSILMSIVAFSSVVVSYTSMFIAYTQLTGTSGDIIRVICIVEALVFTAFFTTGCVLALRVRRLNTTAKDICLADDRQTAKCEPKEDNRED